MCEDDGMRAWVYILTNRLNGTLYVGLTTDIHQRVVQHHAGAVDGFTNKYRLRLLVHLEEYPELDAARARERQIKQWHRKWKTDLIARHNPYWRDLTPDLVHV